MRPKKRQESCAQDMFRARLDQIIDLDHAVMRLILIGGSSRANSVRKVSRIFRSAPETGKE